MDKNLIHKRVAFWQKMLKIMCIAAVCLTVFNQSFAQRNYFFTNISAHDGLSSAIVQYIFQDSNGLLWISTDNGLNLYNGYTIKVFKNNPADSTSIPGNNCGAISEDTEGNIWVGVSGNRIAKFDPKDQTFTAFPIETGNEVKISGFKSALTDQNGNLWFGSSVYGMQRFNKQKNKFELVNLDSSNKNYRWGSINCIKELKNGNILVSDYGNGLKIYNRTKDSFQPYSLGSDYNLSHIYSIYEDIQGNIWFGGENEIFRYSVLMDSVKYYNLTGWYGNKAAVNNSTDLVQDSEGYLWIAVSKSGFFRFDPKTEDIEQFNFNPNAVNYSRTVEIGNIFKDKYGVIWIANLTEGLTKFDPLKEPVIYSKLTTSHYPGSEMNSITAISGNQKNNILIIGTSTNGLYTYNMASKDFSEFNCRLNNSPFPKTNINIQCLTTDKKGNTWFVYNKSGLNIIDNNNIVKAVSSPNQKKVPTYNINTLKTDHLENIWMASQCGFEVYNPANNSFKLLPTYMNKPMSNEFNQYIHKIATTREPISSILKVGDALNLEKKFTIPEAQKVLVICVGEGTVSKGGLYDTGSLFTTGGNLIWSMNQIFETFNNGGGFANRIGIKCFDLPKGDYNITFSSDVGHAYGNWNFEPPPDSVWYGIQVLKINDDEFTRITELNNSEINSANFMMMGNGTCIEFSKKQENVVWLGSLRNGFFKYNQATESFEQFVLEPNDRFSPINEISCLFEDSNGMLWIATKENLIRFDSKTSKTERFEIKDGLPSNQINSIFEDFQGNIWINTPAGLSRINWNAGMPKINFTTIATDAELQNFSSGKAFWISKNGEIFIGTKSGLYSFYPEKNNDVQPDLIIEDIKVSDVSLKSGTFGLKKSIMKSEELHFLSNQNNLSFEFAALHFSRPTKNKVAYKLEGFNDNWIYTDRNFVSFTNLEPGEYTFRIKGSNSNGIWNENGKAIRIIIHNPWWAKWWAITIYIIIFFISVWTVHTFQKARTIRNEREKSQKKELEQAREIEKAYKELKSTQAQLIHCEKMASMGELTAGIAHEIQNPLNFVNNFSEVSAELLDEMKEELEEGSRQYAAGSLQSGEEKLKLAAEIADDVMQNLKKINYHGKRAGEIVKGMLQHSRTSSGQKELTNINVLADEYLRIAFHGLKARDKSFNADYKTDFDPTLPKINVIPQDIGRVLLNLINNAFYAVGIGKSATDEKTITVETRHALSLQQKPPQPDYNPTVIVSTKNMASHVEIRVIDNGPGIPPHIVDKIFQPFFTTKPTGQGTGLGLSLSYDIVKAHGGELKVETKEGEGSEFIIFLPL